MERDRETEMQTDGQTDIDREGDQGRETDTELMICCGSKRWD